MTLIPFLNRHPRGDLSAYIDGELSTRAMQRIETHLAACPACAADLAELRQASSAVRSLPETAPPRSFALTPEMARRTQPLPAASRGASLTPVVNGLRLASGGLATALVVVLAIVIAGGNGSDNGDGSSLTQLEAIGRQGTDASGGLYSLAPEATNANAPAASADGGTTGGSGGVGGAVAGAPSPAASEDSAMSIPTPATTETADRSYGENIKATEAGGDDDNVDGASPEAASNSLDQAGSDDGIDALTVVAIVLGVLLGVALIGSFAASRLVRRA